MALSDAVDRWLGRASNFWTFAGPIIPGTLGAILIGYASTGVAWIAQFGTFGWLSAGALAFLLFSIAFAGLAFARNQMTASAARRKWAKDVDAINPLDNDFIRKRVRISDLANPTSSLISNKSFTDCEIIGPALVVLTGDVSFVHSGFLNCNFIVVRNDRSIAGAIALKNLRITGGSLEQLTICIAEHQLAHLHELPMVFLNRVGDPEIDDRPNILGRVDQRKPNA